MQTFIEILESIEQSKTDAAKLRILEQNRENIEFISVLKYAYDYKFSFSVATHQIPVVTPEKDNSFSQSNWGNFRHILLQLSSRYEVSKVSVFYDLYNLFLKCSFYENKWYRRILCKNLNISIAMIQKVWPKAFSIFGIMHPIYLDDLFGVSSSQWWEGFPVIAEPIIHGMRLIIVSGVDECHAYDENGVLVKIDRKLSSLCTKMSPSCVFDGVFSEEDNVYYIFDKIALTFFSGCDNTPHKVRKRELRKVAVHSEMVEYLQHEKISSVGDLDRFYSRCQQNGHNGMVVKYPSAPYMSGVSDAWLKIQPK